MTDSAETAESCRQLFCAVLVTAFEEHRLRIRAALDGEQFIRINMKRIRIMALDREVAAARRYFRSKDAEMIAECAGVTIRIDRIMSALESMEPLDGRSRNGR